MSRKLKGKVTSLFTKGEEPRISKAPLKRVVQIKCVKCGAIFTEDEGLSEIQVRQVKTKMRKRKIKIRKLKPASSDSDWYHEQAKKDFQVRKKMVQGGLPSLGKRR